MRKIIFILLIFLGFNPVFALSELKDVGIAKFAVLEVLRDNVPLRSSDNEGARRITHFFKDTVLFATKQTDKYYYVELKDNLHGFVNKKDIDVQGIIPEKRFGRIRKISFSPDKKKYDIKIETDDISPFVINEKANELDFRLFDSHFNSKTKIDRKAIDKTNLFEISNKSESELQIKYSNSSPLFGYGVEKIENGYIYFVKKPPKINKQKPLKNITVVVDPGHGGAERGACANGLEEKKINLEISKKLKHQLSKKGAKVYLTRNKDKKVDLYDRVKFAKEKEADILLSIHQNSLPDPSMVNTKHGTGTYYYHNQSKALAEEIQKEMLLATGFKDDKINYASFVLTRPSAQISVLIECGYIIHPEEAKKIADKKFQKTISEAIVKGVENYLIKSF